MLTVNHANIMEVYEIKVKISLLIYPQPPVLQGNHY